MALLTTDRLPAPEPTVPALDPTALDAADADTRRRAVLALRGDAAAGPALLARLGVEDDLAVRQALLDVLVGTGGEAVAVGLARLLDSQDAHLRNEVITALSEMPAAAPAFVDHLLAVGDVDVRIFAVNILRDLRHPGTVDWLRQVIETEGHPNVVGTALDHALEVASPDMRQAVAAARARFADVPYIAFVCDLILDRTGGRA